MSRPLLRFQGVVVALLLALPIAARAASGTSVTVSVVTDRTVYPDGLYRGAFTATGACVPASDDVAVTRSVCSDDPAVVDEAEGTVRQVSLGFDAVHRVEAAPVDVPVLETSQAAVPEQSETVLVLLRRPGDLTVRVTGQPIDGFDPRPVPGSATPSGEFGERTVTWSKPAADAGQHVFSVRFRPGAPAGHTGSFVPEVSVELKEQPKGLLDFAMGTVPSDAPVDRTSTLMMRQVISPEYGPPAMSTTAFFPAKGSDPNPVGWEAGVAMDARGRYQSTVSGPVAATTVGSLSELAPEAVGVVSGAWIASGWYEIRGQQKAKPFMDFEFTPDGDVSGFVAAVQTSPTVDAFGLGAGGSTIWNGDTARFGIFGGVHALNARRQGTPANDIGALRPDFGGGVTYEWSGLWANPVPGAEPNRLNPYAYVYGSPSPYGYSYNVLHVNSATVPMVVEGGDLDNRSGGTVTGESAVIPYPPGEVAVSAIALHVYIPETNYRAEMTIRPGNAATVTPTVRPGGYWLESTRNGYDRDWSNVTYANVFTDTGTQRPLPEGVALVQGGLALVPPGMAGEIEAIDAATGRTERMPLGPGVWRVRFTADEGLSAVKTG